MKSIICIYQEPCLVSHHWPSCVCSLLTSLASLVSSVICPWPGVRRWEGCCPWEGGSHTSEECWQCPEVSEAPATSQPQLQPDLPSLDQEAGWGHSDWDISRTIHDDALSSHCCPPLHCYPHPDNNYIIISDHFIDVLHLFLSWWYSQRFW